MQTSDFVAPFASDVGVSVGDHVEWARDPATGESTAALVYNVYLEGEPITADAAKIAAANLLAAAEWVEAHPGARPIVVQPLPPAGQAAVVRRIEDMVRVAHIADKLLRAPSQAVDGVVTYEVRP